jgi:chromosome segregation ATPase
MSEVAYEEQGASQTLDVGEESGSAGETVQDALTLLHDPLRRILVKELDLLDRDRSRERDLLAEEIKAEQTYLKERKGLAALSPGAEYSQEEIGRATDWLRAQQDQLEKEEEALQQKLEQIQDGVKDQQRTIERWEQDLQELFNQLRALPAELKKAGELVEQLRATLKDVESRGFKARVDMLKQDLEAAETRQKRLSSQEKWLDEAIEEGLTGWREARATLRQMVVGTDTDEDKDSQEDLEICIKQVNKMRKYLQQHQDDLIQRYLEQQAQQ